MLIRAKNPHGGDIYSTPIMYDFSANISPLGTPELVKTAIRKSADYISAYPDPYCRELRTAISKKHSIPSDYIICSSGAAELIFNFAAAIKPRRALIVSPTFSEYKDALFSVGCVCESYMLKEETNFNLTIDLLSKIDKSIDLVVICNPNNPTSRLYSKVLMENISSCCLENNVSLFVDECFMDLTGKEENSLISLIETNKKLFILKAFTKSYGLAGVRLGYGISSDSQLLERISEMTQPWNVSTVAQMAGVAALSSEGHISQNISIINEERPKLMDALIKIGCTVFDSEANFILFKSDTNIYNKLMNEGIQIRRCGNFEGLNDSFYRIAIKSKVENAALIEALAR